MEAGVVFAMPRAKASAMPAATVTGGPASLELADPGHPEEGLLIRLRLRTRPARRQQRCSFRRTADGNGAATRTGSRPRWVRTPTAPERSARADRQSTGRDGDTSD